jgi:hypothetical protein
MFLEIGDGFDPARDFPRYEATPPRVKQWQDPDGLDAGAGARSRARRTVG